VEHQERCDLLADEVERLASLLDGHSLDVPVPSCPGWSLGDLVEHLGTVHRWAERLVATLAPERVGPEAMGLGAPEPSAPWLRAGGHRLVTTLRRSDPEAGMWAWGADQHVRFWSRRQLHETVVHRMDAQLALGQVPAVAPPVAADGTDEFLVNLARSTYFSPLVKNLQGEGARLVFRATDVGRQWTITLQPTGFEVVPGTSVNGTGTGATGGGGTGSAEAVVAAPALALLLLVYRRKSITSEGISIAGDQGLVDFWLQNSALE
jgi:uncharacterized protein (TIGR03083 family)